MSKTEAQITTIELNRAIFRLRHARTTGEKILLEKTVKWLRNKIEEYKKNDLPPNPYLGQIKKTKE